LKKYDLHLNRNKCSFQKRIECNKISKSPEKIRAIIDMPGPSDVEGLLDFSGRSLTTYYFCQIIPQPLILFDIFFQRTQGSDGQQHEEKFSLK
jgi:hypothetical protein